MKCLDCGYNITPDDIDEHEGHEITEGFFEEVSNGTDISGISPKAKAKGDFGQEEKKEASNKRVKGINA